MDNHGQNGKEPINTGSSEKLLPSAPTSTSPFPPDVSFNAAGNNGQSTMAADAEAAKAARHTELLLAQQAADQRALEAQPPPPPPGMPLGPTNNAADDTLTDFDQLGIVSSHARTKDISAFGTLILSGISIILIAVTLLQSSKD